MLSLFAKDPSCGCPNIFSRAFNEFSDQVPFLQISNSYEELFFVRQLHNSEGSVRSEGNDPPRTGEMIREVRIEWINDPRPAILRETQSVAPLDIADSCVVEEAQGVLAAANAYPGPF